MWFQPEEMFIYEKSYNQIHSYWWKLSVFPWYGKKAKLSAPIIST